MLHPLSHWNLPETSRNFQKDLRWVENQPSRCCRHNEVYPSSAWIGDHPEKWGGNKQNGMYYAFALTHHCLGDTGITLMSLPSCSILYTISALLTLKECTMHTRIQVIMLWTTGLVFFALPHSYHSTLVRDPGELDNGTDLMMSRMVLQIAYHVSEYNSLFLERYSCITSETLFTYTSGFSSLSDRYVAVDLVSYRRSVFWRERHKSLPLLQNHPFYRDTFCSVFVNSATPVFWRFSSCSFVAKKPSSSFRPSM